ncbi:MAG: hypothetical protein MZU79_01515 [Anaerotruncus sp.]|nr:hypothetical protein [Anaerotruncus sp.]
MVGAVAALAFGMIAANIWIADENIQYVIYFFSLIAILVVAGLFKTKLDRTTQLSYLIKIRANQGGPLPMNRTKNPDDLPDHLKSLGYERFAWDLDHAIYHRVTKDQIKRLFPRYMLEIVILVNQRKNVFYLEQADQEIAKIQEKYLKEKKVMDRMTITQVKEIGILDDATKDLIKEIIFIRSNRTVISTINVGLYRAEGVAVMLYSDTYRPSLYYAAPRERNQENHLNREGVARIIIPKRRLPFLFRSQWHIKKRMSRRRGTTAYIRFCME